MRHDEVLPLHDLDLEMAVLGAVILESRVCDEVLELLTIDSFYDVSNSHIFQSVIDLRKEKSPVEALSIVNDLRKKKLLDHVGGPGYISRLTNKIASASNVQHHCLLLKEMETARKYMALGYRFIEMGVNPGFDIFRANDFALDEVNKILNVASIKKSINNLELANELTKKIELASQMQGVTGVPTGFNDLDRLTGGFQKGTFVVMAARPGMGKTALALCMMLNAVIRFKKKVIFFSREMPALELFQRLCSIHMNIDSNKFRRGDLTNEEWKVYHANLEPLLGKNLVIVDDCKTMPEIYLRTKKERLNGEVDEVIIDYLQLVKGPEKNREQEISNISRSCKEMAGDLNVPVIALSQLSRSVETRGGDKRPQLSDLRESGAIEQDADIVTFIYRPPYYGDTSHGDDAAFILVAKHRNGKLQDIKLKFVPYLTKFLDQDQTTIPF